jgi:L-ribulose-5-phosphate 3-epimerase
VRIGMLGRFFPGNWRPPADEIRFAGENGFAAVQIRSDEPGEISGLLRADTAEIGRAFADNGVEPVVEMLLRLNTHPSIADALRANLDALAELGCRRVHVHPVPGGREVDIDELHRRLPGLFAEAVAVAQDAGLMLGVEHNSVEHRLLVDAQACRALLDDVPGLSFVWDLNHADPREYEGLRDRLSLVHASDTPLPVTNHHLPIGRGSVDFSVLAGVEVPVVLEIGGLPASGGPGFDTDDALRAARAELVSLFGDQITAVERELEP